ncbi:DUF547 domain-containing protein [Vibrio ostreicida]|uniref:DUF547 domain-containing protein n=1 Tax=Vibrio ostreicida TaxID=526588 RepID=UPI000970802E|nr:DUF547 domain-containing protein [Vibrio ostreicida]
MNKFFSAIIAIFTFNAVAAPESDLWSYWNTSNEQNSQVISHNSWQTILDRYLVAQEENTLFRYKSISEQDHEKLKDYISDLSTLDPRQFSKDEQYAYWVNLYNALTVELIINAYPVSSITQLGRLFSFGPWGDDIVSITGQDLSLNDIEHRILRPIWNEPRTHYAVNCASLGCPNLQPQAFTANNRELLLEKSANEFINSKKGVQIQGEDLQLSSIYEWFSVDFGTKAELMSHLIKYRPELAQKKGKHRYDYDWSLNEDK